MDLEVPGSSPGAGTSALSIIVEDLRSAPISASHSLLAAAYTRPSCEPRRAVCRCFYEREDDLRCLGEPTVTRSPFVQHPNPVADLAAIPKHGP